MNSSSAAFPLIDAAGVQSPAVPGSLAETGIDREVLLSLLLKICYTSSQTTTELAAARMLLPIPLIAEMLEDFGPQEVGRPHVRPLEGKLWEIRMQGRDGIARAVYASPSKSRYGPSGSRARRPARAVPDSRGPIFRGFRR